MHLQCCAAGCQTESLCDIFVTKLWIFWVSFFILWFGQTFLSYDGMQFILLFSTTNMLCNYIFRFTDVSTRWLKMWIPLFPHWCFFRKMIPSECRSLYFCTFHRTLLIAIFYNRCAVGLYLTFCDSWFLSHLLSVIEKRRFYLRGKIQRIYSLNCSFPMCTHCDCVMVISVVIALRDTLYTWPLFYF